MKSNVLFMFKKLKFEKIKKEKSSQIIFYFKLYIIGIGRDKVTFEPTSNQSLRLFKNFLKLLQIHLSFFQTLLISSKVVPII